MKSARVVFQALDWAEADEASGDDSARLVVKVYGRMVDGVVVKARLHGFTPSMLAPMSRRRAAAHVDIADLKDVELSTTKLRDMSGYHPDPRTFTVMRFVTAQAYCTARRKLKDQGVELYNCRLQPFMQMIHRAGVSPSGWVSVPAAPEDQGVIEAECEWTDLTAVADPPAPMAPFVVTSYDIECYSASGDFPAANKGYNKLGREAVQYADSLRENHSLDEIADFLETAIFSSLSGQPGALTPCDIIEGGRAPRMESLRQDLLVDLFDMMRSPRWAAAPATERIAKVAAKMNSLTDRGHRASLVAAADAISAAVASSFISSLQSGCTRDQTDYDALAKGRDAGRAESPWAAPLSIDSICRAALRAARSAYEVSQNADDVLEQIRNKAKRGATMEATQSALPWARPPLPPLKGDPVIQVGLTTRVGRSDDLARTALVLGTCDEIPGVSLKTFDDEASLLKAFAHEIRSVDPDFVTGYNVMGFDFAYLRDRAQELGVTDEEMEMGRDTGIERGWRNPIFLEKRMVSAAYGDNTLRYYDMPGRVVFDLMKVVQREHKLSSYKLDAVARHFTGDCKDDLSPADIFRMHAQGATERATVAKYCVQDCALVSDLVEKLNTLPNALGMADVCLVPAAWIFLRGQGCKVLSLVAKRCRMDGFAMPELRRQDAEGYDGAFVLTPRIGVYLDTPVAVLDFSSLYPSSMIATNLSHDTMLDIGQPDPEGVQVQGVTFVLRDKRGGEREVTRRFVQAGSDGAHEGILPRTLKTLLGSRAAVRKRMKTAPDDFARSVLDGLQQAYKVTANSLYGQLGSATSDICCVDIAASTTAVGRSMLIKLKDFVEAERGGDVIYGDSVAGYTPVFVRWRGVVMLDTVENVGRTVGQDMWRPCIDPGRQDKECIEFSELDIWSDAGWTPARRLIRHRLAPHKRMLRVLTRTGVVDVTDDHSLLRPDGSEAKPNDLVVGDRLLHVDHPGLDDALEVVGEEWRDISDALREGWECVSRSMGGDGDGYVRVELVDQLSAARLFALASSLGYSTGVDGDSVVTIEKPGLEEEGDDSVTTVKELPSFGEGFVYDFTTDNHHFAAGVGRIVVHNTDSCFMTFPQACRGLNGKDSLRATIDAAKACSDEFRKHIPPPQNAEYEKTFWPFVLISKKRYVGNLYEEDPDAKPKQKSMGLVLKRRDNAPIVKTVYGGVIDRLLNGADVDGAALFVRDCMQELVAGRVPVADLVVSKNLGGEYADPDRIAHAVLARRMAERDPGSAPAVGDRVPYVYIRPAGGHEKGALQGDKIEHPDHLCDQPIDYEHYITNQVQKPVAQLFALMVTRITGCRLTDEELESQHQVFLNDCDGDEERARKKLDAVKQAEVTRLIFADCLAACERRRMGVRDIQSYF
jgi:DNA polymerase elongation subunit (family B)